MRTLERPKSIISGDCPPYYCWNSVQFSSNQADWPGVIYYLDSFKRFYDDPWSLHSTATTPRASGARTRAPPQRTPIQWRTWIKSTPRTTNPLTSGPLPRTYSEVMIYFWAASNRATVAVFHVSSRWLCNRDRVDTECHSACHRVWITMRGWICSSRSS